MTKTILLIIFFAIAFSSFSQTGSPSPALSKQDYLQKSKKQKTTAWILLAGGATVGFIGLTQFNFAGSDREVNNGAATVMFLTGTAAAITSIPFFKASKRNKNKAASMSLIMDRVPVLQTKGLASINYPAISFRLPI
jgi:uncharacterized membrane protein YuzA (DUF378 family)